MKDKRCVP